ncbi:MAG: Rab family GTPase [Candidatus Helarchaeota archaeon]
MMVTTTIRYKMVLFGSAGVGKTSLVERFINDRFEEEYFSTLGYNVYEKVIPHDTIEISLMIFDIGGQERFRDLRKKYAEGADCAFIVYDVTNEVSYDEIKLWVKDLKEFISSTIQALDFFETSAKTGHGVENAFTQLALKTYQIKNRRTSSHDI